MSSASATLRFTEKQGQYLALIHTYVLLNRQPPAEADFQRFFCVTPPSVQQTRTGEDHDPLAQLGRA
jgi:repressor LexA